MRTFFCLMFLVSAFGLSVPGNATEHDLVIRGGDL